MSVLQYYNFVAIYDTDSNGDNTVPSRSIEVRVKSSGAYATIYSDEAGTTPITQPGAVTDSDGVLEFWAAPDVYTVTDGVRTETIELKPRPLDYATLTNATNSALVKENNFVVTTERTAGNGGGREYSVVDTATVTPNGDDIVQSIADVNISFVERKNGSQYGNDDARYRTLSTVVRQDSSGSGWFKIDDANHRPVNTGAISVDGDNNLVIDYGFTATRIGSFAATLDETFTRLGVTVGASVGTSNAILEFYAPIAGAISGSGSAGILPSTGSTGEFTQVVDVANGTISVTHPVQTHVQSTGTPILTSLYDDSAGAELVVTNQTKTGFDLEYRVPMHGVITYPGGTATYTGPVPGVSVIFNSTPGQEGFEITHPQINTQDKTVSITAQGTGSSLIHYEVQTSVSGTFFKVVLFDSSGTKITSPSGATRFSFHRPGMAPAALPNTTFGEVKRDLVKVDANELYNTQANVWIYGVFEY